MSPRRDFGRNILLIDDNREVRETTGLMLQELGYRVSAADCGAAGLATLDSDQNFDLVMVDFAMPGMDGIEVAEKISDARPGLPIVMITAYADAVRWSAPLTDLHLLEKPFRLNKLASALMAAQSHHLVDASSNVVPFHQKGGDDGHSRRRRSIRGA